jgi:futalosine hydrolase
MNILIVSATYNEIAPLINKLEARSSPTYLFHEPYLYYLRYLNTDIDILISGIGMTSTTYHLTKYITTQNKKYNYVINIGIAGSFNKNIALGEVVNVTTDCFSEMGAEDGDEFISFSHLNLLDTSSVRNLESHPPKGKCGFDGLKKVKGITVNTVHGNDTSIKKVKKQFAPDVESMEGAAFFYCCLSENISAIQIRAISNYVEKRNKENWKIELAIKNLNETLLQFLFSIYSH